MSEPNAADWLYQEVIDHLDADILGTYELLWLLRGSNYALSDEQAKLLARSTLAILLAERPLLIVPLKWPGREEAGKPVAFETLSDDQLFEFSEDGVYYAVVPSDSEDPAEAQ
jgi:hypothetical protein